MTTPPKPRTDLHIPTATLLKLLFTALLVWAGVKLWPELVLLFVAVILAIALEPAVDWLDHHGLSRSMSVIILAVLLLAVLALVGIFVVPPLFQQAGDFVRRLPQLEQQIRREIAPDNALVRDWVDALIKLSSGTEAASRLGSLVVVGQATVSGAVTTGLVFIVTLYLVQDGKQLYAWLLAYVPHSHRGKMAATVPEVTRVVRAYVRGQVLTSVLFSLFAAVVLTAARVPAVVPLALFAGLCDVVPMIGIVIAIAPAALLALVNSKLAALGVIAAYLLYHQLETYVIAPRIYGSRLRLSTLTVLLALIFGVSLFGLVGAVLILPMVAAYPTIERIWLKDYLGSHVIDEHGALAAAIESGQETAVEAVLREEKRADQPPPRPRGKPAA